MMLYKKILCVLSIMILSLQITSCSKSPTALKPSSSSKSHSTSTASTNLTSDDNNNAETSEDNATGIASTSQEKNPSSGQNSSAANPSQNTSKNSATTKSVNGTTAKNTNAQTTKPTTPNQLPSQDWEQTEFIISSFLTFDGDTNAVKNKRIAKNTLDAGINVAEVTWLGAEPSIIAALDAAEETGLKLIVQNARGQNDAGTSLGGIGKTHIPKNISQSKVNEWVNKIKNYSSLYGYYVWDEPFTPGFQDCAQLTNWYTQADKGRLAFSCVLPSYGDYRWPTAYPSYVDQYLNTVNPKVLSMNYYPFLTAGNSIKTTSDLWRDLGYIRKKALEKNIPQWHYFQAVRDNTPISVNEIKVQMSAGLAYGVKGLSYFTSQYAVTNVDGTPAANYNSLKSWNLQVRNIGNLLFGKDNIALYHTNLNSSYNSQYYLNPLASSEYIKSAPANLAIGIFSDSSRKYMVFANKDHLASVSGKVALQNSKTIKAYSALNNTFSAVGNASSFNISIEAGGVAVYSFE